MSKSVFKCGYCCKEYTQANRFERHFTICSFNNKKFRTVSINKSISLETLNTKMDKILYILESQNKRIENLEKKIVKRKKIVKNIKLWLNENIIINFKLDNWKKNIEISDFDYDCVVKDGYINGYLRILLKNIKKIENKFIYAFNGGTNKFYIFDKEWKLLDISLFNNILFSIQRLLIIMAIDKRDNMKNISEEKEREMLRENSIIYGNNHNDWNIKIYNKLYKNLKIKIDDII